MKELFGHFCHLENSFTVPHPICQNYLLFVLIQMSGYSDFSYQGSMLENSTKDHHFLVLLIASKDPSKNAYSALFKQKGAKSCIMKSGKKKSNLGKSKQGELFFC